MLPNKFSTKFDKVGMLYLYGILGLLITISIASLVRVCIMLVCCM